MLSTKDQLIEIAVYGGGGGFLGCGLAIVILAALRRFGSGLTFGDGPGILGLAWLLVGGLSLGGFLLGAIGGERGINWIGSKIRDWEPKP
jgi:hypothetical protein